MCKGLPGRERCTEWVSRINTKNIIRVFTAELQKRNVSLMVWCMERLPVLPAVYSSYVSALSVDFSNKSIFEFWVPFLQDRCLKKSP